MTLEISNTSQLSGLTDFGPDENAEGQYFKALTVVSVSSVSSFIQDLSSPDFLLGSPIPNAHILSPGSGNRLCGFESKLC